MPDPVVPTLAIVGGGASGTLVAIHALAQARAPLAVVLVEARPEVGRGVAYATAHALHRLNVPAGKMSAFPDAPADFLEWLRSGPMPEATAATFAPRGLFGRYLAETLAGAASGAAPGVTLRVIHDTAVAVEPSGAVRLASGETVRAARVVLALGQTTGGALPALAGLNSDVLVADPWAPGALGGVGGRVLLVGTGLTMLDVALALAAAGAGPMTAVSRRGLVPHGHAPAGAAAGSPAEAPPVQGLAATLRRVRAAPDWRTAVDALRPTTAERWRAFTDAERRSALRHLRPYWDVHRHRAAPEVAAAVAALRASGRLAVVAGRVVSAEAGPDGARVRIARRRVSPPGEPGPDPGGGEADLTVDHVVLCTGARPAGDTPVVAGLVAAGAARRDALGLGVETDPDGALVEVDGRASRVLFTLGPLRQGALWETTAIPEIRVQAAALAARLVAAQTVP